MLDNPSIVVSQSDIATWLLNVCGWLLYMEVPLGNPRQQSSLCLVPVSALSEQHEKLSGYHRERSWE